MYRPLVISAVVVIFSCVACAHEDNAVVAAPVAPPPKQHTTGAAQQQPRDLSSVTIHMERKACYGICPSYVVDVTGDGQVSYMGHEFVNVRGAKKGTANPTQVSQLMDAVDQLRLTTLVDAPRCASTDGDQPTVIVAVRDRGATTKVTHDLGNSCYPKELTELESMIDEVANTSQWVRCEAGFCLN
jgi:hypothetical protein